MERKNISFVNLTTGVNNRFRFKKEHAQAFSAQLNNYEDGTTAELMASFIDNIKADKPLLFNPFKVQAAQDGEYLILDGNTRFLVLKNTMDTILATYAEMGKVLKPKDIKLPCEVYEPGELTAKMLGEINNIGAKEHYLGVCYDMYMAHQSGEEYSQIAKRYTGIKAPTVKENVKIYTEYLRSPLAEIAFTHVLDRAGAAKLVSYNNELLYDEVYSFMGLYPDENPTFKVKTENVREIVLKQITPVDACLMAAFGAEITQEPSYIMFDYHAFFVSVKSDDALLQKYRIRYQDLQAKELNIRAIAEMPFGYTQADANTAFAEKVLFRQGCGDIIYIVRHEYKKHKRANLVTQTDMQNKIDEINENSKIAIRKEWYNFFMSELDNENSVLRLELAAIEEKIGYLDKDFKFLFGKQPVVSYAKATLFRDNVLYDQYYDLYIKHIDQCKHVRNEVANIVVTAQEKVNEVKKAHAKYLEMCKAVEDAMLSVHSVYMGEWGEDGDISCYIRFVIAENGTPILIQDQTNLAHSQIHCSIYENDDLFDYLGVLINLFGGDAKNYSVEQSLQFLAEIYKSLSNKEFESDVNKLHELVRPYINNGLDEQRLWLYDEIHQLCKNKTVEHGGPRL